MNIFKPCSICFKSPFYYGNGYHSIPAIENHSKGVEADIAPFQDYDAICYSNGVVISTKGGHYIAEAPKNSPINVMASTLENIRFILYENISSEEKINLLKQLIS